MTQINHSRSRIEPTKEGRSSSQWLVLERWVNEFGWTAGAEIGLQRGWTTCHLLEKCPELSMIGVDFWQEPDPEYLLTPGAQSYDHIDLDYWAEVVKRRVGSYGDRGKVLHMDSVKAADHVEDDSLDFVFIDGDHTEAGCTRDIRAWAPKVKPTGWVCGHDWHYRTVAAALDHLCPGWERHSDFCWRVPRGAVRL